jgi:hypothetical protein
MYRSQIGRVSIYEMTGNQSSIKFLAHGEIAARICSEGTKLHAFRRKTGARAPKLSFILGKIYVARFAGMIPCVLFAC